MDAYEKLAQAADPYAALAAPASVKRKTSIVGRVASSAAEGFKEGFGGPVQGPSPFVEKNLIGTGPLSAITRPLLEGIPAAVQATGKTIAGLISGAAGAVGQGLEEAGVPGAKEQVTGMTRQVMQLPIIPELTGPGALAARGGVKPQVVGPSGKLEEGALEASQILSARGATMPAQKLTSSAALDQLSNVASSSILGGGRMRRADEKAQDAAQAAVQEVVDQYTSTASKTDVGEMLQNAVGDAADTFRATARGAYRAVDDAMKQEVGGNGGVVDLRPAKAKALEIYNEIAKGLEKPDSYGWLNNLLTKGDFVPFEDAQLIRSDLLGIGRNAQDVITGKAQAYGKRLAPSVDAAMETAATNVGPAALTAWRDANNLWKSGKETFNSQVVKAVANKDPELVYQSLVKNGRPASVRRVRELVSKEQWQDIQGQFIRDMIVEATDVDGTVLGSKFLAQIQKYKKGDIYKEVVTDSEISGYLEDLARTVRLTQKGNASGSFKLRTSISNAGYVPEIYAAYSLTSGGGVVLNGAILLGPRAISHILTSKKLSKWLTEGMGNPSGSLKGDKAARNLISALVAAGVIDRNQSPTQNLNMLNADQARALQQQKARNVPMVPTGP